MPSADDLNPNEITKGAFILLKSPVGFGKTLAACSAAVDGKVWHAYWDKSKPLELTWFRKIGRGDILKNITYNIYGAANANEFLNKLVDEVKRPSYQTIVVDSVTMMTTSAVNWSLGFRSGGKKDDDKITPQLIPDFDDYKIETSLVTQSLDLCRKLAGQGINIIWTCHPISRLKIEGSGKSMSVSKIESIVSYGSKVADLLPGQFNEIYHLVKETEWDQHKGQSIEKRLVYTKSLGDVMTKSVINLPTKFDITDKLFWEVWKSEVAKANQPITNPVTNPSK